MSLTKSSYDIVVVGGGGGSLSAWKAAERGVDVLMIEKDREIGLPVRCAEAIGADVVHRYLEKDPRYTRRRSSTDYLDAFIEEHLPNSTPLGMIVGSVPVAYTLDDIVTDGLMVVGDAARRVNPSTGGGIAQAMTAGEIAGKIAGEAIKKGDVSKEELFRYRKAWDKRYGNLQKRIYGIKEAIHKLSDKHLNETVAVFKDKNHVHVFELVTKVLIHQPGMILNFMRAFAGR